MMSLKRFSDRSIREFLSHQAGLDFSYSEVGATQGELPAGYVVDRACSQVGTGTKDFSRAKQELMKWQHLQLSWIAPCWPNTQVEEGAVIGVLARRYGFWFLNACRVVHLIDERDELSHRFGFAYGTLPGHAECGEERFLLEYDEDTRQLKYDILAFSRPNTWYTKLAYPLVRREQKRFARDSIAAMKRAVEAE